MVAGLFSGGSQLDGVPVAGLNFGGGTDALVLAFAADGTYSWAKGFGGAESEVALDVAFSSANDVYITGYFRSSPLDIGTFTLTSPSGGTHHAVFVAKLAALDGTPLWAREFGDAAPPTTNANQGFAVAVDGAGDIIIGGKFSNMVTLDGTPSDITVTSSGTTDAFVARLNGTDGLARWVTKSATADGSGDLTEDIIVSGTTAFACGSFDDTMTFEGVGTPALATDVGAFVASFDVATGAVQNVVGWDGTLVDTARALAIDPAGNVIVVGSYQSATLDFGGATVTNTSSGTYDTFLLKLDSSLGYLDSLSFGSPLDDRPELVDIDPTNGNIVFTGWFGGTFDHGTGTLMTDGMTDGFVASFGTF